MSKAPVTCLYCHEWAEFGSTQMVAVDCNVEGPGIRWAHTKCYDKARYPGDLIRVMRPGDITPTEFPNSVDGFLGAARFILSAY